MPTVEGNSWGRWTRQKPKWLNFVLRTQLGRGSRMLTSVVPAGGAGATGVSDVGLVNGHCQDSRGR